MRRFAALVAAAALLFTSAAHAHSGFYSPYTFGYGNATPSPVQPTLPNSACFPQPAFWVRGDVGITLGTGVLTWKDQSGKGNDVTQPVGASQPTYSAGAVPNGQPTLVFSGTQWLAGTTSPCASGSCTFFIVQRFTGSLTSLMTAYTSGSGATPGGIGFSAGAVPNTRELVFAGIGVTNDLTSPTTNNWELWTMTTAPTPTQVLRVNGAQQALDNSSVSPQPYQAAQAVGSLQSTSLVTGMVGDETEIVVYDSVLSAARITALEQSYLLVRYGL